MIPPRNVFVTGGTGYIGSRLIPLLDERGHIVRALARRESVERVPEDADPIIGNALDASTFSDALTPRDTIVHLIGTPHPNPSKAAEFQRVDLASIRASVEAAREVGVEHIIYVSVAQPAPVMKEYIAARTAGEQAIRDAGLTATILRPWYVLGPGHRWPAMLAPLYAAARLFPATRDGATRLGMVSLQQMIAALVNAVENPPAKGSVRVLEVPEIRSSSLEEVTEL